MRFEAAWLKPSRCRTIATKILGRTHSDRATTMIRDLISCSSACDDKLCLQMSDDVSSAMSNLRKFLYDNVYRSPRVHKDFEKAKKILTELYLYLLENEDVLQKQLAELKMTGCNDRNRAEKESSVT